MPFYSSKISDAGTSNPIVARIFFGLSEIIEIAKLPQEVHKNVMDLLFDISQELLEAEKASVQVIQEIDKIESELPEKMKTILPGSLPKSIDSVLSINRVREFLKYAQSAFRKLGRIMSIIFKIGYKEHRFWNILSELNKILPLDAQIFEVLQHYKPWYQKIIDLRDTDEHPHSSSSFLINYEIKTSKEYSYLARPMLHDKTPIYQFLIESSQMLLHFSEDLVLAAIIEYLPDFTEIIEIPPDERNPQCPKRFRIILSTMGP